MHVVLGERHTTLQGLTQGDLHNGLQGEQQGDLQVTLQGDLHMVLQGDKQVVSHTVVVVVQVVTLVQQVHGLQWQTAQQVQGET